MGKGGGGVRYSEKVKDRESDAGGFIKKQLVNKFSVFFFLELHRRSINLFIELRSTRHDKCRNDNSTSKVEQNKTRTMKIKLMEKKLI